MFRSRLAPLLLAFVLAGCDSTLHMTGAPANAPLGADAGVPATLLAGPGGQAVTIGNPGLLPLAVRQATNLKASFGGTIVPVSRANGGQYVFTIPASARVQQDVSGNLAVVFVMDDRTSQIVPLRTGSPIAFGQPAILTTPSPAFLVKGLSVHLKANTQADPARYQFTWSFSASGQPPFSPIAGTGAELDWTPPVAGNFAIKVDAVDKTTQQVFSATTPEAIVFVSDAKTVITTTPPTGSIRRGQPVGLTFNPPAALAASTLSYAWSYAASPQGPFLPIPGSGASVNFLPTANGSYFIRVDATDQGTGKVYSFLGPDASVFVAEGQPVIGVSSSTTGRGDAYTLSLNIPGVSGGPFTWYYAVTTPAAPGAPPAGPPGASYNFQRLPGTGATVNALANETGAYVFRVDVPQPNGAIKSFVSNDPQLNVVETTPLIQSLPANLVTPPGTTVQLMLNARGIDASQYRFSWFATTNPLIGFQPLPISRLSDTTSKQYNWQTSQQMPSGAYYVRVDASRLDGTATTSFVSSAPVVSLQCSGGVLPGAICAPSR